MEPRYAAFEKAKNYTKQYELDKIDSIVTRQEDEMLGYISAGQFATTGSNIFTGGQIILGNLTIDGDIYANQFNVTTSSVEHFTASTSFGLDQGDTHSFTGSVRITGSLNVIGNTTITGSIYVSGGINGQINATNGVISGSAQVVSALPAGTISGSAQITSFGFVSGSYETTGRSILSSSTQILNYNIFATTGSNTFIGAQIVTGSLSTSGSNSLIGNTILSGTLNVSGSTTFRGTNRVSGAFYIESSSLFYQSSGSALVSYDQTTGQLFHTTYASALPALFAAGGFYSTGSYTATANISSSFIFDTTLGINSVHLNGSGSHIVTDKSATYNLQFSIQLAQGPSSADVAVWLKRNGANVADTATYITMASNTKQLMALNLWDTANAGDYWELAYQSNSSNTTFQTIPASGSIPRSPSIILTINQIR